MKPEKMTDEALKNLEDIPLTATVSGMTVFHLLAHIAALTAELAGARRVFDAEVSTLTAERDALQKKWDGAETELNAIQREANAAGAERDALRERVHDLGIQLQAEKAHCDAIRLDEQCARAELQRDVIEPLRRENADLEQRNADACAMLNELRERVQALEAEIERLKRNTREAQQYASEAVEERIAAESHLAAIRQRAGDVDTLAKVGETCAIMGSLDTGWDEAVHADVVERGDVQMLRDVSHGVARYVLGEDEAGRRQAATTARHPEGTVCMSPTCAQCATRHDPTTAEAFATVRAVLSGWSRVVGANSIVLDNYLSTLSLLERRMGASDKALRAILAWDDDGRQSGMTAIVTLARQALTNAPPVFTLEDVRAAMDDWCNREQLDEVSKRLVTLRKG